MGNNSINLTNVKKYDFYDIINVFYSIYLNENCSRRCICDCIEIGEGSLKSILNFLEEKKLIEKSQTGNSISKLGMMVIENIEKEIGIIKKIDFDIFKDNFIAFGVSLKNYDKKKIEHIYFARDYAIRCGCWSAMILKYNGNDVRLNENDSKNYNFNELLNEFKLDRGNLIILTSAESKRIALKGILKILEYLNYNLKEIFKKSFSFE